MSHILTVVSSKKPLTKGTIADIGDVIENATKSKPGEPEWLCADKALDIHLPQGPNAMLWMDLRDFLSEMKADFFITPQENRRKIILLADMDSTIVAEETLDELAGFAGIKNKIAAITKRAMNGELNFHDAIRERVALLKDLPIDSLHKTLQETTINDGAKTLVATMKKHGAKCVLVSGGFTFFTENIGKAVGFDAHHGNILDIAENRLTGIVKGPILDKSAKVTLLDHYTENHNLPHAQTMTIGDGANDIPMLKKSQDNNGLGIGFYPKQTVKDNIFNIIEHNDLSAALYAQGYKEDEIERIS